MLYRIYTEDINRSDIEDIVSREYTGFTLLNATGYWERTPESSVVVELVTKGSDRPRVNRVAEAIKQANKQSAVLVQELNNDNWLI